MEQFGQKIINISLSHHKTPNTLLFILIGFDQCFPIYLPPSIYAEFSNHALWESSENLKGSLRPLSGSSGLTSQGFVSLIFQ